MWDKEHGVCSVMADNIFPKTGWYVWDMGDAWEAAKASITGALKYGN